MSPLLWCAKENWAAILSFSSDLLWLLNCLASCNNLDTMVLLLQLSSALQQLHLMLTFGILGPIFVYGSCSQATEQHLAAAVS